MNGIDPRIACICITTTRTIAMFIMDFLKGFDIVAQIPSWERYYPMTS
jgi:hypothetical protein